MSLNALGLYAAGVAAIHVFWAFFYLVGTLVWAPRLGGGPKPGRFGGALLDVIVAIAGGMAITAFCTFALALCRLLYPASAIAILAAALIASALLGDSPLRRSYWRLRVKMLVAAATPASLALYVLTLVLAVPAILPDTTFDATFFHLVYAVDWAHAHALIVDPWVRFPYYAQNWILLDAWVFELHLGSLIEFLGWSAVALSILGTFALVDALAANLGIARTRFVGAAGVLCALSVATAPMFERWGDTGMVDVPIGFFFLMCVSATLMAVVTRDRRWCVYTILCFGFFAGMKGSFFAFIPMGVAATWISLRAARVSARKAAVGCALVLALSIPWYAKNFIQAGDPIAPYLHLALHEPDSKWTAADMQGVLADLRVDQSPLFLLKFPVYVLEHPETTQFREPGVSFMMFFLMLPGIALVDALRRPASPRTLSWALYSAMLLYAIAYWLLSAHMGRYALLFYPSLAAFVGLVALFIARASRARTIVAIGGLALAALPAPAGSAWLNQYWNVDFTHIEQTYPNRQAFLLSHVPAYREEEQLSASIARAGVADPRVYVFGDYEQVLAFYFKLHGVTKIGDWFGPERWSDFAAAIDQGRAAAWLKGFRISGVIVGKHILATPERMIKLRRQLIAAGYRDASIAGQPEHVFFGPGLTP